MPEAPPPEASAPPKPYSCHPSAVIDPGAEIGPHTQIWHFCHLMSGAKVGARCTLGQNVFIASGVTLGDGVKVQNNVSLYAGVTLADNVFCGPSMVFTNVRNPRAHVERKHAFEPTPVGRGATLGANCTVVCGNPIGAYAVVAAGAVVTRPVPAHALVVGVPARLAAWMCICGERLTDTAERPTAPLQCAHCGQGFEPHPAGLSPVA